MVTPTKPSLSQATSGNSHVHLHTPSHLCDRFLLQAEIGRLT